MNPAIVFGGGVLAGALAGSLLGGAGGLLPRVIHHLTGASGHDVASHAVHTRESFDFVLQGPWDAVAPLFGAERERAWAPDWNPAFLWPQPAADRERMVFTVPHDDRTAVWVNTVYQPDAGRFQYVYVLPDVVATVIGVQLTRVQERTQVHVTYERTALTAAAGTTVSTMAQHDAQAGPEWERLINEYLATKEK